MIREWEQKQFEQLRRSSNSSSNNYKHCYLLNTVLVVYWMKILINDCWAMSTWEMYVFLIFIRGSNVTHDSSIVYKNLRVRHLKKWSKRPSVSFSAVVSPCPNLRTWFSYSKLIFEFRCIFFLTWASDNDTYKWRFSSTKSGSFFSLTSIRRRSWQIAID